ncbi:subtilisin-like protein [Acephala macrosclerotiorum]|nr:subtilisin-like protein [Acephala macrosclerotiorum]
MDQFGAPLEEALDKIAHGWIDQGIDLWETTFEEVEPYLSKTEGLLIREEYAQTLQAMGVVDRAKEVDAKIEEVLERDEVEGEVTLHDRDKLLENIARRWNLQTTPDDYHEDSDDSISPPRSESREANPRASPLETPAAPPVVQRPLRRAQSLIIPNRTTTSTEESVKEMNQSVAVEQSVVGDVLFSSCRSFRRPRLQALDLRTDKGKAQWWYSQLEETTHNFMYGEGSKFFGKKADGRSYVPVRIAVLDNGIAHTKKEDKKAMKKYWGRVRGYASFLHGEKPSDALIDETGHGTAVSFQLLKTCPTAEIYICRVVKSTEEELIVDKDAVERAIYEMIDEEKWKVDIINMSFGWDYNDHPGVKKAIATARAQDVLLFASTSNFGVTTLNDMLYPALADEVISVDAADGMGEPATFNPSSIMPGKERFSAPGIGLSSPVHEDEQFDGTSFASPIAAGVAALILEFARQTPLAGSPSVSACLHARDGIALILRAMKKQKGVDPFQFLCPWQLLGDAWGLYGGDGQAFSRRSFVAQDIVQRLRTKFGKKIGDEISTTLCQKRT